MLEGVHSYSAMFGGLIHASLVLQCCWFGEKRFRWASHIDRSLEMARLYTCFDSLTVLGGSIDAVFCFDMLWCVRCVRNLFPMIWCVTCQI